MLFKLAWRNIWRQKRRTLLTASALGLALFLSLFMRSTQEGSYAHNIDTVARLSSGLAQLQNSQYYDSQSIDDLIPGSAAFISPAREILDITFAIPRIETFSLIAANDKSKGVMVIGIDPELEAQYSSIEEKIVTGAFLQSGEQQIIIGQSLANFLNISTGDEIVLYGQGYRGQTAAGLFTIKGTFHLPQAQLDSQLIYLPLDTAQKLFSTDGQVTNWLIHTDTVSHLPKVIDQLKQRYHSNIDVLDWQTLIPELAQQITLDRVSGIFLMYVLYGVVGFGLFATLLMMTLERQREFSVMMATGMVRQKLLQLIAIESGFIAMIGIVIGVVITTPLLLWFSRFPIQLTGETAAMMEEMGYDPIIPVLLSLDFYYEQILMVLIILVLCLIYPMFRLYRLEIVAGLKGGTHAH